MRNHRSRLILFLCVTGMLMMTGCATLAPCPGSLLPIVEIQVNNTASTHDDYGTTGSNLACRARITNPTGFNNSTNFPGGVNIELRNPTGIPNLQFATTAGGATSASIFQNLPQNGGWRDFWVRGTGTSATDKTAIIEMATSGSCTEVVVARKAMMIPSGAAPIAAAPNPQVEIEINASSATLDDYVTWSPTSARVRWINGSAGTTTNVTIASTGATPLVFANNSLGAGATATLSTLPLTLNGDGTWVNFYVAGQFPAAPPRGSIRDKDAILEVRNGANAPVAREGLMVRIRKNANSLEDEERNRYLAALVKINATYANYIQFVRTHSRDSTGTGGSLVSHRQAHSGSGFLPWHRAFVLHIERLLQSADPSVALPYWKFDDNAPNMFTAAFMGSNTAGNFANLTGNPLATWTLAGEGIAMAGIQRRTPYGDGGHPDLNTEADTLALGGGSFLYGSFASSMETNPHNRAHSRSGFTNGSGQPLPGASWVGGSPAIAPRDPLFFFLHSNIDRLWAKWQKAHNRNLPTAIDSYDLQGSHTTQPAGVPPPAFTQNINGQITANRTLGQYAEDSLWPWDNVTGGAGTAARPDIAILTPFPIVLGGLQPFARPQVRSLVDYAGLTLAGPSFGLGYAYDDFSPY